MVRVKLPPQWDGDRGVDHKLEPRNSLACIKNMYSGRELVIIRDMLAHESGHNLVIVQNFRERMLSFSELFALEDDPGTNTMRNSVCTQLPKCREAAREAGAAPHDSGGADATRQDMANSDAGVKQLGVEKPDGCSGVIHAAQAEVAADSEGRGESAKSCH